MSVQILIEPHKLTNDIASCMDKSAIDGEIKTKLKGLDNKIANLCEL